MDNSNKADYLIRCALSCLDDQLKNHPTRDGESVGYRIEQAITLLKDALEVVLADG